MHMFLAGNVDIPASSAGKAKAGVALARCLLQVRKTAA
jgi:hypothetical protein